MSEFYLFYSSIFSDPVHPNSNLREVGNLDKVIFRCTLHVNEQVKVALPSLAVHLCILALVSCKVVVLIRTVLHQLHFTFSDICQRLRRCILLHLKYLLTLYCVPIPSGSRILFIMTQSIFAIVRR